MVSEVSPAEQLIENSGKMTLSDMARSIDMHFICSSFDLFEKVTSHEHPKVLTKGHEGSQLATRTYCSGQIYQTLSRGLSEHPTNLTYPDT